MVERYDHAFRIGDAITFKANHRPYIDLSIPASQNDLRDASCINISIYDETLKETILSCDNMVRIPNRPGQYFYRFQTTRNMKPGVYVAIITAITRIDGKDYTNRNVQEFRLINDGVL